MAGLITELKMRAAVVDGEGEVSGPRAPAVPFFNLIPTKETCRMLQERRLKGLAFRGWRSGVGVPRRAAAVILQRAVCV